MKTVEMDSWGVDESDVPQSMVPDWDIPAEEPEPRNTRKTVSSAKAKNVKLTYLPPYIAQELFVALRVLQHHAWAAGIALTLVLIPVGGMIHQDYQVSKTKFEVRAQYQNCLGALFNRQVSVSDLPDLQIRKIDSWNIVTIEEARQATQVCLERLQEIDQTNPSKKWSRIAMSQYILKRNQVNIQPTG